MECLYLHDEIVVAWADPIGTTILSAHVAILHCTNISLGSPSLTATTLATASSKSSSSFVTHLPIDYLAVVEIA